MYGLYLIYHREKYEWNKKTLLLQALGLTTLAAGLAGSDCIMEKQVEDFNTIIYTNNSLASPSTDPDDIYDAWVSLGVDKSLLAHFYISQMAVFPLVKVFDKMFKSCDLRTLTGRRFSYNSLFQLVPASNLAFLGIISHYACVSVEENTAWHEMWLPHAAAGTILVAGLFSLYTFKRPFSSTSIMVATGMQMIGVVILTAATVVCAMGIKDNVDILRAEDMAVEDFDPDLTYNKVVVSAVIYALIIDFCFAMTLYCLIIINRLMTLGSSLGIWCTGGSIYSSSTCESEVPLMVTRQPPPPAPVVLNPAPVVASRRHHPYAAQPVQPMQFNRPTVPYTAWKQATQYPAVHRLKQAPVAMYPNVNYVTYPGYSHA